MKILKARNSATGREVTLFAEKYELKKQGLSVRINGEWNYLPDTYIVRIDDVDPDRGSLIFNKETLERYLAESRDE